MDRYYVQTDGHDSPDAALKKLRAELTGLNQNFIKRMTAVLKRWVGAETPLRSVKDEAPVDPPPVETPAEPETTNGGDKPETPAPEETTEKPEGDKSSTK